jgi:CubicO group peptidase (beta-lactamase class C family)
MDCEQAVYSKAAPRNISLLLSFVMVVSTCTHASPADEAKQIGNLMEALYQRGQFNGVILVAKQGHPIYRKVFGKANFQTNADLTPETPFCLASVSKQFTAMAIILLAQQNKLTYDDPVSKYIPEFAHSQPVNQITLRQLLNHTSGIPDYGDLGLDDSNLTPDRLIKGIVDRLSLLLTPGRKYRYSNPGYALLAIVVQRVSGQSFGDFLQQRVFGPLGMGQTFVFDDARKKGKNAATGYSQFGKEDDVNPTLVPGDGGIYSTVDDLFKWDQALYTNKLLPQSALAVAFTPGKVEEGTTAYGFGWNIAEDGGGKYVWHTGSTAGFRAFIERRLTPRTTVIMLTNRGNSKRQDINKAIVNIFAGKPYVLPQRSGAEKMYEVIGQSGIEASLQMFDSLKKAETSEYDLGESELNTLGYELLYGDKKPAEAVAIFKLNATENPRSSNAFDSLGEAYEKNGDKKLAVQSYKTAIKLDPSNQHAMTRLKELQQ